MVESYTTPRNTARGAAIVLAGGSGTRLGRSDDMNKVYLPLAGRPIISWSLATLDAHRKIDRLVLVIRPGDEALAEEALAISGLGGRCRVVHGGRTRTESEQAGLAVLQSEIDKGAIDTVLIHDGARPFLDDALIDRLFEGVRLAGGAIPGLGVEDDVVEHHQVSKAGQSVVRLADSTRWYRAQTPQAFEAGALVRAYEKARQTNWMGFDTAELVRWAGGPLALVVEGNRQNIKVTTPPDLAWAEAYAASRL